MSKVKLPKEVAEAVEGVKTHITTEAYYDITWIHRNAEHHSDIRKVSRFLNAKPENVQTYFSALVNGYEVERTPEEELREYYEEHRMGNLRSDRTVGQVNVAIGRRDGVEKTLSILGINIEGINGGSEE